MSQIFRPTWIFPALFLIAVILGYFLTRTADQPANTSQNPSANTNQKRSSTAALSDSKRMMMPRAARHVGHSGNEEATPPFAIPGERIARFNSDEAYRKFLASLEDRGFILLGKSDRLRSVRFGIGNNFNPDDIEGAKLGYNYLVSVPTPPDAQAQQGAIGFGRDALSWLGVTGDNSSWGSGVSVAVLDSGVNNHITLNGGNGKITTISLTDLTEGSTQLSHGTAVASIISGDHPLAPGVAPAADIISIRITDASGSSDSFTLAEGILTAVDSGADIINISMGSYGNSSIVADAVRYALEQGSVVVASAGNEGLETIAYPAAYQGVIAVGAVEADGQHLDFSNSGKNLSITAPGYQVNAAWGEELLTSFSGTSASAPFISGAIAATMSANPHLTAQQAADLVIRLTNDAGYPGADTAYGSGILALDRVMEHGTAGIYDAAITSQVIIAAETPTSLPQVLVTVQNQGTETLINSPVKTVTPNGTQTRNISSLSPGQIHTFRVPIPLSVNGNAITVRSSVKTTEDDKDTSNNSRSDQFP